MGIHRAAEVAWQAVRAALLRWQLFAIAVLPLWLLVGYGVFGGGPAGLFPLLLGTGVLVVFLAVLAGLTRLRPTVRRNRRLGPLDTGLTLAFHLALLGLGFYGATGVAFGLASVVLGLGTFWFTVAELTREWRDRVSGAVRRTSADPGPASHQRPHRRGAGDGDVIVVHEADR
jgi:hypothetical protein